MSPKAKMISLQYKQGKLFQRRLIDKIRQIGTLIDKQTSFLERMFTNKVELTGACCAKRQQKSKSDKHIQDTSLHILSFRLATYIIYNYFLSILHEKVETFFSILKALISSFFKNTVRSSIRPKCVRLLSVRSAFSMLKNVSASSCNSEILQ